MASKRREEAIDLPPHWKRKYAEEKGKYYYVNQKTKERQWAKPEFPTISKSSKPSRQEPIKNSKKATKFANADDDDDNSSANTHSTPDDASEGSSDGSESQSEFSEFSEEWTEDYSKSRNRTFWRNNRTDEKTWINPYKTQAPVAGSSAASKSKRSALPLAVEISEPGSKKYRESSKAAVPASAQKAQRKTPAPEPVEEWSELFSERHQKRYWRNNVTGESTWRRPAAVQPTVSITVPTPAPASTATPASKAHREALTLPIAASGWSEKFSSKHQRRYWKNEDTGESTWKDPAADAIAPTPIRPRTPTPPLPEPVPEEEWSEKFSERHKRRYWKNNNTGESTWKDPHGPAPILPAPSANAAPTPSLPIPTTAAGAIDPNAPNGAVALAQAAVTLAKAAALAAGVSLDFTAFEPSSTSEPTDPGAEVAAAVAAVSAVAAAVAPAAVSRSAQPVAAPSIESANKTPELVVAAQSIVPFPTSTPTTIPNTTPLPVPTPTAIPAPTPLPTPSTSAPAPPPLDEAQPPAVPEGWKAKLDPTRGRFYYICLATRATQWAHPNPSALQAITPPVPAPSAQTVPAETPAAIVSAQDAPMRGAIESGPASSSYQASSQEPFEPVDRRYQSLEPPPVPSSRTTSNLAPATPNQPVLPAPPVPTGHRYSQSYSTPHPDPPKYLPIPTAIPTPIPAPPAPPPRRASTDNGSGSDVGSNDTAQSRRVPPPPPAGHRGSIFGAAGLTQSGITPAPPPRAVSTRLPPPPPPSGPKRASVVQPPPDQAPTDGLVESKIDMWKRKEAKMTTLQAPPPAPLEKRRSAAIEALSRRTSIGIPGGLGGMLAMEEPHIKEVKRSAAVESLMKRKTLLNDDNHEPIGMLNGHLVRAGDTTHHSLLEGTEEEERQSLSRFDPEVRRGNW